jgi:hypothetical protein
MKIDAQRGWFRGLGDVVCFAWIGEGMMQAGHDVEFFCTGWRQSLFKMFYMKTTDDPFNAIVPTVGYEQAMARKSPHNYLEWLHEQVGSPAPPMRPRHNLEPMQRELGRQASADVLLFPHAVPRPRTWPKSYFIELGLILKRQGFEVRVVTEKRDYDFTCFHEIFDAPWDFLAGAIQSAKLVISNDSGPAHFAGTMGTKTIAVMGMTTEKIYGYLPEVITFRNKKLPCAGCHGLYPYRRSCDSGCMELYRTYPEEVAEVALKQLRADSTMKAKDLIYQAEAYSFRPITENPYAVDTADPLFKHVLPEIKV